MEFYKKIREKLNLLSVINNKIDLLQQAVGRVEEQQSQQNISTNINDHAYKVYSQWKEDGIIQYLINNIEIKNKVFIEFGVENYTEANTRFLLVNNNWSGLVIDGGQKNIDYIKKDNIYWRHNLKAECAFITAENINTLFSKNGIGGDIGILSIDIDGNDYWVWQAIDSISPRIVIIEYNSRLGMGKSITVPYNPKFYRLSAHYSGIYYGASIRAMVKLGKSKGYSLVASSNALNLFFVKDELLNEKVCAKSVEELFEYNKFREARNADGELIFLSPEEERELLKDMKFVEV